MIRSATVTIAASVGRDGGNRRHDVVAVQALVNEHLPTGTARLAVDGVAGPLTIAAIEAFQRHLAGLHRPDGRVDPHGRTLHALNTAETAPHPIASARAAHPHHPVAAGAGSPRTPHAGGASPAHVPQPSSPAHVPQPSAGAHGFSAEIILAAKNAQAQTKIPAAITLAQWAIESGYGRHMPAGSNNPFGIKAAAGEPYVEARTREVVGGRTIYIDARFRKFASLGEAFEKHGQLLATGRPYAHARTLVANPDQFADALTGVYATDPNYGTLLKSVMRSANLYQYD